MAIKVSQLEDASTLNGEELLMMVQNNASVKATLAKILEYINTQELNASTLNGMEASDFVPASNGTAENARKLGNVNASDYATKSDLSRITDNADFTWCSPKMWFGAIPEQYRNDYRYCDGSWLSVSAFSDLYDIIGTIYNPWENGEKIIRNGFFALPDLRGRVPMGGNGVSQQIDPHSAGIEVLGTQNLPGGQVLIGNVNEQSMQYGGSYENYLIDVNQIPQHRHYMSPTNNTNAYVALGQNGGVMRAQINTGGGGALVDYREAAAVHATALGYGAVFERDSQEHYEGLQITPKTYPMLQPFTMFNWIMRVTKPAQ